MIFQEQPGASNWHLLTVLISGANTALLLGLIFKAGQYKQKIDQLWSWFERQMKRDEERRERWIKHES